MKKKIAALFLAASMLFVGCGAKPVKNEQETPGGYIEQKIEWPEDFYCTGIYPNADNSVTLLGAKGWQGWSLSGYDKESGIKKGYQGGIEIYDVQSDGTVKQRDIPWEKTLISLCEKSPHDISMAMNEAGELYVLASEISQYGVVLEEPFQLYRVENDGLIPIAMEFQELEEEWFPTPKIQYDYGACQLLGASKDYFFIGNNSASWAIWDTSGKLHKSDMLRIGAALYTQDVRNGYVWTGNTNERDTAYTLPDFQSAGKMEIPEGEIFPDYEGDGFYHMTNGVDFETRERKEKILSHYSLNGDTREILMRGGDFSWGSSSIWMGAETPDHAFWMILNNQGSQGLCRYEYDPNKRVENTLAIFALHGSNTLTQAITLWNQQHPQTRIELTIGSQDTEQTAMTEEDVIRQLNTQLLAGDGPDVLILDDLPADALIRQGMLADLSELVDTENMRPNVRAAFEQGDGLYGIPTGMNAYIAGGETSDMDDRILSLAGLADAVEAMPDPDESEDSCLSFGNPMYESLFDLFYPASAPEIWRDGQFDRDGFLNFVQSLARIARRNHGETIAAFDYRMQQSEDTDSMSGTERYHLFKASALNEFWNGKGRWFVDNWEHAFSAGCFSRIVGNKIGNLRTEYPPISLYPLPGVTPQTSGVYAPVCVAAIPKSSTEHQELAAEFIQLMLSDEMQGDVHGLEGLPVTSEGFEVALKQVQMKEPFVLTTDVNALLNDMVPVNLDPVLQAAVREAAAKLYDGEYTEEQACTAIEQAAAIRLAEQQ